MSFFSRTHPSTIISTTDNTQCALKENLSFAVRNQQKKKKSSCDMSQPTRIIST
jgi:hypothetical protein